MRLTRTMQPSAVDAASPCSTSSWGNVCVIGLPPPGVEDVDAANSADGQPWLTGATWPGWALPQLKAPPRTYVCGPPDRLHRSPELGGRGLVGDVAKLPGQLAVLDPEEALPVNWKLNRCMSIDQDRSPTT
jgi:hypothetical protein